MHRVCLLVLLLLPFDASARKLDLPGLHNVYQVMDQLYSGSGPDGDASFRSLAKLGVKTIISVDGARPDVERARRFGLRYVHLPIGYDGVPRDQALRIARAVRDLPGPVYLHCHHGRHRGPAAAVVAKLCLDPGCTTATAVELLKQIGTDPRYRGLYASTTTLKRPTQGELDQLPAVFQEVATVTALTEVMVRLDSHLERLKQVRAVGWKASPRHPDVDPAHEALQFLEQHREALRLPQVQAQSQEFQKLLRDGQEAAGQLEALLRAGKSKPVETTRAEQVYRRLTASCTACHEQFRDTPKE